MTTGRVIIANPCDAERQLLGHLLATDGFSVLEASSARAVLDQARGEHVDLIILATQGWQAAALNALAALRRDPELCDMPVLILGCAEDRSATAADGPSDTATWVDREGFRIEVFIEKARGLLQSVRHERPAASGRAPGAESGQLEGTDGKLTESQVRRVLAAIDNLPAFESTITDAITTLPSGASPIEHIVGIVGRDPMLTANVLGWANERTDEEGGPTIDLQQAVGRLGERQFYRRAEAVSPLAFDAARIWDPGCYWAHSLATARIAVLLSQRSGLGTPVEAAAAGLLHDIGAHILATHFPKHFGVLFSAAMGAVATDAERETRLIGIHHGQLSGWLLERFGLPQWFCDVALAHHLAPTEARMLGPAARMLLPIVQIADRIADVLFPGSPPLAHLTPIDREFDSILSGSNVTPDVLLDESRKIMADLVTEMAWLFPQTTSRAYYHERPLLDHVLYFVHGQPPIDLVRTFFETRSHKVTTLTSPHETSKAPAVPIVVNLAHAGEPAVVIEALSIFAATGSRATRKGVILVSREVDPRHRKLLSDHWKLVQVPTFPLPWLRWLAEPVSRVRPAAPEPAAA